MVTTSEAITQSVKYTGIQNLVLFKHYKTLTVVAVVTRFIVDSEFIFLNNCLLPKWRSWNVVSVNFTAWSLFQNYFLTHLNLLNCLVLYRSTDCVAERKFKGFKRAVGTPEYNGYSFLYMVGLQITAWEMFRPDCSDFQILAPAVNM